MWLVRLRARFEHAETPWVKRRFLSLFVTIAVTGGLWWAGGANYGDPSTPGPLKTPMTFPVIGKVSYTDTFGAPRDGGARAHEGTDIMGSKMQQLVAAVDGTVTQLTIPQPSYGYMLVITGDDGWSYHYLHINNDTPGTDDGQATLDQVFAPGLKKGDRVNAGQFVAYMGDSGNAESTGPHLHFELHDPSGAAVNAYASLKASTVITAPGDAAPAVPDLPRIWGQDRVATAIAASKSAWSTSANVVLASGSAYAEALPASVLAARKLGPLLLADDGDLSTRVVSEINRLKATKVIVVGSVPASADAAVAATGRVVERVGVAGDPVETAAALARVIGASSGNAVVVNADRFADGVSASALAAGRSWPILLTTDTALPDVTRATLQSLKVAHTWVIGGSAVVGDDVVAAVPGGARLAGADRYDTSVEVVRKVMSIGGRSLGRTYLATGTAYPDALAGGALAAQTRGIVVLVDGSGAGSDTATRDYLQSQGAVLKAVLGGFAAVGIDASRTLGQLFGLS
jgi:putative cell wall-binding protein